MNIETKFKVNQKVYFLGIDGLEVLIHEDVVKSIDIDVDEHNEVRISYFLTDYDEDSLYEFCVFGSVAALLDYLKDPLHIVTSDPEQVIYGNL